MLHKIIQFSVNNKLVIGVFILLWIIYGSYQVTQLPIDAVPDITNNQVQVITTAPSLGAEDVERLITFPIEQAISNIPGLIELFLMTAPIFTGPGNRLPNAFRRLKQIKMQIPLSWHPQQRVWVKFTSM
jgi:hypothetical protein